MAEPGEGDGAGGAKRDTGRRSRSRPVDMDKLFDVLQTTVAAGPKTATNAVGMAFVLVPSGTFQMGSPDAEPGHRANEGPVHEVVVGSPFYLATHLVTQAQYLAVVGKNPSRFTPPNGGLDHPVEMVSWEDAVAFCRQLGARAEERAAGRSYRLPTEAEWEYACRAGTAKPFGHGTTFDASVGNFDWVHPTGDFPSAAPPGRTTPVARFPASAWGLYDMHGNVWEWCADWYGETYYRSSPLRDPPGPAQGKTKVLRGGSWRNHASACRAAYRNALAPHQKDSASGFRVVLVAGG